MSPQAPCPEPARLQELLEGSLPETVQADLAGHVEACVRCQQKLEELGLKTVLSPEVRLLPVRASLCTLPRLFSCLQETPT